MLMGSLTLAPLFLVCIYRPDQEHKCWHLPTIASRKCAERYTDVRLSELTAGQSRKLVESLLAVDELPEPVKALIIDRSQGNPFFLEEVVRSLMDRDLVYEEGDRWRAREGIDASVIPENIQAVILARMDRTEESLRNVLQGASVIGRVFRRRALQHVTEEQGELEGRLDDLEHHALIYLERTVPEEEYSFKHNLTQETLYNQILKSQRLHFHGMVVQAIEALYREDIDEYYEQLAYHYDRSDDAERAVDDLLKAGKQARQRYSNEEAIRHLRRVLERIDRAQLTEPLIETRFAALVDLSEVYLATAQAAEADRLLRRALGSVPEMGARPSVNARDCIFCSPGRCSR